MKKQILNKKNPSHANLFAGTVLPRFHPASFSPELVEGHQGIFKNSIKLQLCQQLSSLNKAMVSNMVTIVKFIFLTASSPGHFLMMFPKSLLDKILKYVQAQLLVSQSIQYRLFD